MPGNTIAHIAIAPANKIYIAKPKFKSAILTLSPPLIGLKYVIKDTIKIPIIANIIFLYLPLILSFSSFIIKGIENTINPKNNELTLYIFVSNKLVKTNVAKAIPTIQPVPNLNKNHKALFFFLKSP